MNSKLNLHSAYFAQIDALVASRGSLKVVHQAMWQMDNAMQMSRHSLMRITEPVRGGIEIECG